MTNTECSQLYICSLNLSPELQTRMFNKSLDVHTWSKRHFKINMSRTIFLSSSKLLLPISSHLSNRKLFQLLRSKTSVISDYCHSLTFYVQSIGSTFKIFLEANQFLPLLPKPLLIQVIIISCLLPLTSLPVNTLTFFWSILSRATRVIHLKCKCHVTRLLRTLQ